MKKRAFTCLVKPLARIWTRAKAYLAWLHSQSSQTKFASVHSYGFTLAEVLITLTILGVVAAITVPSLQKQNYKRTQVTRLAKAYSALNDAASNIAQNTNCVGKDLKCTGLLDISDRSELNKKFVEYSGLRGTLKTYNTNIYVNALSTGRNSMPIAALFSTTPDDIAYTVEKDNYFALKGNKQTPALHITVFTDAKKLFNDNGTLIDWSKSETDRKAVLGRDVFNFALYGNFVVEPTTINSYGNRIPLSVAVSGKGNDYYIDAQCNPKGNPGNGDSCAAKIIREGWKMNY